MKLYKIFFFLFIFSFISVRAQDYWEAFPFFDAIKVMKKNNNNLWIGTNSGLVKFDINTEELETYSKFSNEAPILKISDFVFDQNNNIWVAAENGGIALYDHDTWKYFSTEDLGHQGYWVSSIDVEPNGNVWFGMRTGGLGMFDGENFTVFNKINSELPSDGVYDVFIDSNNVKWIGTSKGLVKIDAENWEIFNTINSGLPANTINQIREYEDDLWIITHSQVEPHNSVVKFDGTQFSYFNSSNADVKYMHLYDMIVESENSIWLCSDAGIINFNGEEFTVFNDKKLDQSEVGTLVVDASKFWVTNNITGLYTLKDGIFESKNITPSYLNFQDVKSLALDNNNNLYVGTYRRFWKNKSGVSIYDNTNWTPLMIENKLEEFDEVKDIAVDSNYIWIAYKNSGLVRLSSNCNEIINLPNSATVEKMVLDSFNNIWFATNKGVIKYIDGTFIEYNSSNSELNSNYIRFITTDNDNNLWALTDKLYKYTDGEFQLYDLEITGIGSIKFDLNNHMWIATYLDGLVKYDSTNYTYFTVQNSNIPSSKINEIEVDSENNIWIASEPYRDENYEPHRGGIGKFNGEDWVIHNYSNSGLLSNYTKSIKVSGSDVVYIGTLSGVSILNQIDSLGYPQAPSIFTATPITNTSIELAWSATDDVNSYIIERKVGEFGNYFNIKELGTSELLFVDSNLTENVYYYYRIKSIRKNKSSIYNSLGIVTTIYSLPNGKPESIEIEIIEKLEPTFQRMFYIDWIDNSTNEVGFVVERKEPDSQTFTILDSLITRTIEKGNSVRFIDEDVLERGEYHYRIKAFNPAGASNYSNTASVLITGISEINYNENLYSLNQNFPNPFNPATRISFQIPNNEFVTLKIYDVVGQEVKTLVNKKMQKGKYDIDFNASQLSSGIYFYRIQAGKFIDTKKLILLK